MGCTWLLSFSSRKSQHSSSKTEKTDRDAAHRSLLYDQWSGRVRYQLAEIIVTGFPRDTESCVPVTSHTGQAGRDSGAISNMLYLWNVPSWKLLPFVLIPVGGWVPKTAGTLLHVVKITSFLGDIRTFIIPLASVNQETLTNYDPCFHYYHLSFFSHCNREFKLSVLSVVGNPVETDFVCLACPVWLFSFTEA